jgi:hypothetical protein
MSDDQTVPKKTARSPRRIWKLLGISALGIVGLAAVAAGMLVVFGESLASRVYPYPSRFNPKEFVVREGAEHLPLSNVGIGAARRTFSQTIDMQEARAGDDPFFSLAIGRCSLMPWGFQYVLVGGQGSYTEFFDGEGLLVARVVGFSDDGHAPVYGDAPPCRHWFEEQLVTNSAH